MKNHHSDKCAKNKTDMERRGYGKTNLENVTPVQEGEESDVVGVPWEDGDQSVVVMAG